MNTHYPILFGVRDPVIGKGFLAEVVVSGRCLMRHEEEGFWIDGVNPGALCAGGETKQEALLKFRENYRDLLKDFASAANSFEEFKAEVERFFWEVTPGEPEAWQKAADELRANRQGAGDWLPLRKDYGDPSLEVVCVAQDSLDPKYNSDMQLELPGKAA